MRRVARFMKAFEIPAGSRARSFRACGRVTLIAGLSWLAAGCGNRDENTQAPIPPGPAPSAPSAVATSGGTNAVPAAPATSWVHAPKLVGRWVRPDGGYVLNIRSVDAASGRLDLEYLNPRPIHVAQAEAKEAGGKVTVFVELQDVGYPGSTYRLTYVPQADQMIGTYFQPAADQSFDVEFVRAR